MPHEESTGFQQRVRHALTGPAVVREGRYQAAPGGRSSRLQAEASGQSIRYAAVLLALVPAAGGWSAVLMERTPHPGVHGGQISFPGGEVEPEDADRLATALREFEEEMGVAVPRSAVLGHLTPLFIPPSGFDVEAFVAVLPEAPRWHPDAREVAAVLHLPLYPRPALQPAAVQAGAVRLRVPSYACEGRTVWGATAILLTELLELMDWGRAST